MREREGFGNAESILSAKESQTRHELIFFCFFNCQIITELVPQLRTAKIVRRDKRQIPVSHYKRCNFPITYQKNSPSFSITALIFSTPTCHCRQWRLTKARNVSFALLYVGPTRQPSSSLHGHGSQLHCCSRTEGKGAKPGRCLIASSTRRGVGPSYGGPRMPAQWRAGQRAVATLVSFTSQLP
jgi:hypothetical protein